MKYRAMQSILPVPFLLAGALLFFTGPIPPDVVVQGGGEDNPPTTEIILPTSIEHKVRICHLPPGNPPNFQIIDIDEHALATHLAHGDIFPVPDDNVCFTPPTTTVPATTTTVDQCPPEDEPCIPTQQTTIPPTTTTTTTTTTTIPPTTTTTTTILGTTTTILPPSPDFLSIGSAASVCSNDVPFVDITFGNQPEFNGIVGTITFQMLDGTVIETHEVTYQANETVRLVYPGASFDPVTGEATDWPGWMLNGDGFWVTDPSDAAFRDGLIVVAEINPTASTTITYPPETAACNSPDGPFPPGSTSGELPATGLQGLGIALLLAGIAIGIGNSVIHIGRKESV